MNESIVVMNTNILKSKQWWKLRQFPMPKTCENCLGLVNSCKYYAHQTREIYQVVKRYLVNVVLFGIKDM